MMFSVHSLIILSILLPISFGSIIMLQRKSVRLIEFLFVSCAILLVCLSVMVAITTSQTSFQPLSLVQILGPLDISIHSEPLGVVFALLASTLFLVTTFYAIGYMRANHEQNLPRFYACFCFALGSVMGICYAGNLLTLFIFYELLTLITYPLVTHKQNREALRSGRIYLGLLLGGSIGFLLVAILWTWILADNISFVTGGILSGHASATTLMLLYTLFILGTGKAGLFPLHQWLPAAMVAPTPVSALLHAVAVVKAGVFVVLKITLYTFGLDLIDDTSTSGIIMFLSILTMIGASLIAIGKDNLKARLAYSTIGQLSYIVLGATIGTSSSVIGSTMHMVTHGVGKITLFFCAGAIYTVTHKTLISEMDGLARRMPITFAAFTIAAFSIIGLPPFAGSWSKWFLLDGALQADNWWAVFAYMLSTVLAIGYLGPIIIRGYSANAFDAGPQSANVERPLLCIIPLSVTAFFTLALFFAIPEIYWYVKQIP